MTQFTALTMAFGLFAVGEMPAQSIYRDPQGRFSVAVPSGWTQTDGGGTLQMRNGETSVMVMVVEGQSSASDLLASVVAHVQSVWTGFKTVGSPPAVKLGGEPAAFELEYGVNPSGVKSFAAIYAITSGGTGFVMTQIGRADQFANVGSQLDAIAANFSLGSRGSENGRAQTPVHPVRQSSGFEASGGSEANYETPDHSLSWKLPAGWKGRVVSRDSGILYVLEPTDSSEQSIFVSVGAAGEENIQRAAEQVIRYSIQAIPGLRLSSSAMLSQGGVEMKYERQTNGGPQIWWQEVVLKDARPLAVTCGGRADAAEALHEKCLGVFRSVRVAPATVQESNQLVSGLVGRWTSYSRSDLTRGSVEKHLAISPNGQFEYSSTVYISGASPDKDPTTRESGTYRVQGNTITAQTRGGKTLTFRAQLLEGGRVLMLGGEKYLRE